MTLQPLEYPPRTTHDYLRQKYKVWQDGLTTRRKSHRSHSCRSQKQHHQHKAGCLLLQGYEAVSAFYESQRMQKSDVPYS